MDMSVGGWNLKGERNVLWRRNGTYLQSLSLDYLELNLYLFRLSCVKSIFAYYQDSKFSFARPIYA